MDTEWGKSLISAGSDAALWRDENWNHLRGGTPINGFSWLPPSGGNPIIDACLVAVFAKCNAWNNIYLKMQCNEMVRKSVHRLKGSLTVQSIVWYGAIAFCSWEDRAFVFREIASGVRTYSLIKPCWMSSFKYLRRVQQCMVWCPLHSWNEQYSDTVSDGLGWIGFGRLTHGRSLKVLKTSSIRSFKGVKRSANLSPGLDLTALWKVPASCREAASYASREHNRELRGWTLTSFRPH